MHRGIWWALACVAVLCAAAAAYVLTGWTAASSVARDLVLARSTSVVDQVDGRYVPAGRDMFAALGKPDAGDVDLRIRDLEVDRQQLVFNFLASNRRNPGAGVWSVQVIVRLGLGGWRVDGGSWNPGDSTWG
jgi:hypothetical protein